MQSKFIPLALAAILLAVHGNPTWADEECIFTSPPYSSPLDIPDGALYGDLGGFYVLWWPPSSELSYSAETNEEESDPCLVGALAFSMLPYRLIIDNKSPIQLNIYAAAQRRTNWLPWPCPQTGYCVVFADSVVAAAPPDVNDFDVAYYITRYYFITIVH